MEQYRDEGYLAAAMRNYLMTLGWAPSGESEIVPWSRIVAEFRLEDVVPSPAFFDVKKLTAFNGEYLRALPIEEFIEACQPWLTGPSAPWPAERYDPDVFAAMAPLVQTRVTTLAEVPRYVDFLFLDEAPTDDGVVGQDHEGRRGRRARRGDRRLRDGAVDGRRPQARGGGGRRGAGPLKSKAQAPVRVAVTGRTVGPPLYESLELLGRERTLDRLRAARSRI